jgi:hypothetical protein
MPRFRSDPPEDRTGSWPSPASTAATLPFVFGGVSPANRIIGTEWLTRLEILSTRSSPFSSSID